MSATLGRPEQANTPSGGQRGHVSAERGGTVTSTALGRPEQANAPSGAIV